MSHSKKTQTPSTTGDTGNAIKVSEQYLKDFVTKNLQPFVDAVKKDPELLELNEFGTGTGGGMTPGNYSALLAGGGPLASAVQLKTAYKKFATTVYQQFTQFQQIIDKTIIDVMTINDVMLSAGDVNDLTAQELMMFLNDVLSPAPTTTPTTTTTDPGPDISKN